MATRRRPERRRWAASSSSPCRPVAPLRGSRERLVCALLVTLGFGGIGFWDDWLKISKRNSKGLRRQQGPLPGADGARGLLRRAHRLELRRRSRGSGWADCGPPPHPAVRQNLEPNLGWLYLPFMVLVISAARNAVNLTDGLDGLAIGPTIVSSMPFLALSYVSATIAGSASPITWRSPTSPARRRARRLLRSARRRYRFSGTTPTRLGVHGRRRLARAGRRARHRASADQAGGSCADHRRGSS